MVQVEGGPVVPNFTGKSMRGAIELAEQSGIALNAMGSGVAREQSPPAGTQLRRTQPSSCVSRVEARVAEAYPGEQALF